MKSFLKLIAILAGLFLIGFPFFNSGRHQLYSDDVQTDLIAIDAGKEQFSIATDTKFGEPMPGGIDFMVENQYLNDPPQARATGTYDVNALATDPEFTPNTEPSADAPALELRVEFSERPTTLATTAEEATEQ